ncbi:MBL fold metallo-hydrolase [Mucilaginibacter auburnensis]|uniref:L-ascorbate metabolism protein UlaG (Beta-lactamase superfamily) n=1 Tax=Mucilaginibacter auburnensis TaxID=1457233 RepID=A0A2H9VS38_9SPHI|nr:MBL fold metallo-hydrolase [Mucilaginibacter auburnensis]PJJ83631.1 L-ascorbate metabolism protein UlaG (beta-lactamase superfamily) [Mucilaginibacter auburnensis]
MKFTRALCLLSLLLTVFLLSECRIIKSVGKNPSGESLKELQQLPNYTMDGFLNLNEAQPRRVTTPATAPRKLTPFRMLRMLNGKPDSVRPSQIMPTVKTNLNAAYDKPTVIWFGHSCFMIKTKTANILFDPELSSFAGPFAGPVNAFEGADVYKPEDMPAIDVLVVSHDHYDHLDYITISKLKERVKKVVVPLGIGSHFKYWGYDNAVITELNWGEAITINEQLNITAMPAHHRSGRGFNGNKTLWASYVIEADGYKMFYSGDTGYTAHFKTIGEHFGPFDLAVMECGQYNTMWSQNHMFPDQTAQAAADLKAKMILPVHWGKFAEAYHGWNESVKTMLPVADSLNVQVTVPKIGEPYTVGTAPLRTPWWNMD